MLRTCLSIVAIAALGRLVSAQETPSPNVANFQNCFVAVAEQADLPPLEAGVIREVAVKEGHQVTEGQLLVQLDDRKARCERDVAKAKADAAKTKFKAADINVEYSESAYAVAKADYKGNEDANKSVPGSVPQEKLRELFLKCTETALSIKKSKSDREGAAAEARVAEAELEAAEVTVDRHRILSPIAGEVVEIVAHKGEAVQPNQAVIHIARLDDVWVEVRVDAAHFARAELDGQEVTVEFKIAHGEKASLTGEVIFVKPLTDTGGLYLVRAKVKNRRVNGKWLLHPGTQVDMSIQLRKLPQG